LRNYFRYRWRWFYKLGKQKILILLSNYEEIWLWCNIIIWSWWWKYAGFEKSWALYEIWLEKWISWYSHWRRRNRGKRRGIWFLRTVQCKIVLCRNHVCFSLVEERIICFKNLWIFLWYYLRTTRAFVSLFFWCVNFETTY